MILSSSAILTFVSLFCFLPFSQGHFLWQQVVATDDGKSTSSFFTFAELPGLENAEGERFAKMLYQKDIRINYVDVLNGGAPLHPTLDLQGDFVVAKLPDELPSSYLLESFCEWGTWSEGGAPVALVKEHTIASKIGRGQGNDEKVHQAATNKFRLDLVRRRSDQCIEQQGEDDHESACVQIKVIYDGDLMPNINITVYDGDSDPIKLVSDANGAAHVSVNRAHARIFAKAGHKVYTPGETAKGDKYELISNWATSVLELGRHLEEYPQENSKNTLSSASSGRLDNASNLRPSAVSM